MTTLDQRILIPAPPDMVWNIISDLENNPTWQADCESLTYLTSIRNRPGTRWRYASFSRREYVLEITAWYEGLGYEYTFVDGAPYKESKGRLRLQEIPEGTIVQWTFTYELGGLLGGVRNSLSIKRQIEAIMVDSLRALWQRITDAKGPQPVREAKSLMRDAPDVFERARYIPRHPSVVAHEAGLPITEPPVSDEDTRPNKPAAKDAPPPVIAEPSAVDAPIEEPDFLADLRATGEMKKSFAAAPQEPESPAFESALQKPDEPVRIQEKQEEAAPSTDAQWKMPEAETSADALPKTETAPAETQEPPLSLQKSTSERELSKLDTAQVSVFEVFGLPKPSETQEIRTVEPKAAVLEPAPTSEDTSPHTVVKAAQAVGIYRRGGRVLMRRRLVRLRYPQ